MMNTGVEERANKSLQGLQKTPLERQPGRFLPKRAGVRLLCTAQFSEEYAWTTLQIVQIISLLTPTHSSHAPQHPSHSNTAAHKPQPQTLPPDHCSVHQTKPRSAQQD